MESLLVSQEAFKNHRQKESSFMTNENTSFSSVDSLSAAPSPVSSSVESTDASSDRSSVTSAGASSDTSSVTGSDNSSDDSSQSSNESFIYVKDCGSQTDEIRFSLNEMRLMAEFLKKNWKKKNKKIVHKVQKTVKIKKSTDFFFFIYKWLQMVNYTAFCQYSKCFCCFFFHFFNLSRK